MKRTEKERIYCFFLESCYYNVVSTCLYKHDDYKYIDISLQTIYVHTNEDLIKYLGFLLANSCVSFSEYIDKKRKKERRTELHRIKTCFSVGDKKKEVFE